MNYPPPQHFKYLWEEGILFAKLQIKSQFINALLLRRT